MDKPACDEPVLKVGESSILDAFKNRWKEVAGKFTGAVLHAYCFDYNENVKSSWYKGTVFPITTDKEQLGKQRGNAASFWLFEPKEESRLRQLASSLLPLSDNSLLQPLHVAYNSQIDKTVVCCTECETSFADWISNEIQVPADGYISDDAKNIISSLLVLSEAIWQNGFVCEDMNDPSSYVRMDSKPQLIPFHIREKRQTDTKMIHRNQLADLLEIRLNARWHDQDVTQFIEVLRNDEASLEFLIDHPLLLPPERRMSMYLLFDKTTNLTMSQNSVYDEMPFYNWIGLIPPTDTVLQKLLTFKQNDQNNTVCMYKVIPVDAHRYCRNTCSHYFDHWRRIFLSSVRSRAQAVMVDKKLKRLFPGFLSMIYALPLNPRWRTRDQRE